MTQKSRPGLLVGEADLGLFSVYRNNIFLTLPQFDILFFFNHFFQIHCLWYVFIIVVILTIVNHPQCNRRNLFTQLTAVSVASTAAGGSFSLSFSSSVWVGNFEYGEDGCGDNMIIVNVNHHRWYCLGTFVLIIYQGLGQTDKFKMTRCQLQTMAIWFWRQGDPNANIIMMMMKMTTMKMNPPLFSHQDLQLVGALTQCRSSPSRSPGMHWSIAKENVRNCHSSLYNH